MPRARVEGAAAASREPERHRHPRAHGARSRAREIPLRSRLPGASLQLAGLFEHAAIDAAHDLSHQFQRASGIEVGTVDVLAADTRREETRTVDVPDVVRRRRLIDQRRPVRKPAAARMPSTVAPAAVPRESPLVPAAASAPSERPTEAASVSRLSEQNDLFSAAMAAERQGQHDLALRKLDDLIAHYPGGPLSESARAERQRILAAQLSR